MKKKLSRLIIAIMIMTLSMSCSSKEGDIATDRSNTGIPNITRVPDVSDDTTPGIITGVPAEEDQSVPGDDTAHDTSAGPASLLLHDASFTAVYDVEKGEYCPAESLATRAFIAVKSDDGVLLSWRCMNDEGKEYTLSKGGEVIYTGILTDYLDAGDIPAGTEYVLSYEESGVMRTEKAVSWDAPYREFALELPPDTKLPNNHMARHWANDMSVGDLDGDGELELIVKWYPEIDSHDNAHEGWTGTTLLDGYDIDMNTGSAMLLWRIDLGINIRSGAHYTQYQVWDYDGDGIAEIMCKTADGTTTYNGQLEETGHVGAVSMSQLDPSKTKKDQEYDYRKTSNGTGYVLSGPEYLTVFSGLTGEIIDTADYIPSRGPEDDKGNADMNSWGDNYGNRVDRFLAGTAYIDEGSPAAIFCRGYYARTTLTAWKLINGRLTLAWYFDAPNDSPYIGQGNHGLSVNDVDGDGFDEIIYGSLCIDNDGSVLYCTGLGHGDAMHVSDWNGDGKLEVFQVHEDASQPYQIELHDAATGEILWGVKTGKDTGRGMAADIDPDNPGAEMWAAANGDTFDSSGNVLYKNKRPSINFSIFWDGDPYMELFDYKDQDTYLPQVQKWDHKKKKNSILLEANGCATNNGTKGNAGLIADIYGDWREEIILRCTEDDAKIRIYSTTYPTEHTIPCLLLDRAYREGVAWQNTAYNQPANLSYLLNRVD